jgi:hypothetical protein
LHGKAGRARKAAGSVAAASAAAAGGSSTAGAATRGAATAAGAISPAELSSGRRDRSKQRPSPQTQHAAGSASRGVAGASACARGVECGLQSAQSAVGTKRHRPAAVSAAGYLEGVAACEGVSVTDIDGAAPAATGGGNSAAGFSSADAPSGVPPAAKRRPADMAHSAAAAVAASQAPAVAAHGTAATSPPPALAVSFLPYGSVAIAAAVRRWRPAGSTASSQGGLQGGVHGADTLPAAAAAAESTSHTSSCSRLLPAAAPSAVKARTTMLAPSGEGAAGAPASVENAPPDESQQRGLLADSGAVVRAGTRGEAAALPVSSAGAEISIPARVGVGTASGTGDAAGAGKLARTAGAGAEGEHGGNAAAASRSRDTRSPLRGGGSVSRHNSNSSTGSSQPVKSGVAAGRLGSMPGTTNSGQ